ncbi:MAG: hypothetical protein WCK48_01825 [bacterium]
MKNTDKAFLWITSILEKHNIQYKISGGFAGRVYGVSRELADIDIEVSETDILKILTDVEEYIIYGPDRYKDENWDLQLMTLNYEGQDIDISGVEAKIFNQKSGQWENCTGDLTNVTLIEVYGKKVPIESIENLITYKTKLARDVDIEDVRQLLLIKK